MITIGTNNEYELIKAQALKRKQDSRESMLKTLSMHQKLSKEFGDKIEQKLIKTEVKSLTTIGGIIQRDLFINALPWGTTIDLQHGVSKKEFTEMEWRVQDQDFTEIKILERNLHLKNAINTMMEDGSTGDKLIKLTDHILRFGAMFLIFIKSDKCQAVFDEWQDKLTTDEIDADGNHITKEQEVMSNEDWFTTIIQKEECDCTTYSCQHTERV